MPIITQRKKWSDSNSLDSVLAAFNSQTIINDDGAVSFSDMRFQELLSLLDDAFAFPANIGPRELNAMIYRAMIDSRKLGLVTKNDLLERLNKKASELLSMPRLEFRMWTYLRVRWDLEGHGFRFQVNDVSIRGMQRLPKNLRLKEFELNGVGQIEPNYYSGFGFTVCSVKARNEDDAARQIFEALDIFSSITNALWREWNIFGGEHHSEAKLWNGPYQFFFHNDKFLGTERLWFNSDFDDKEWNRWPKKRSEFKNVFAVARRGIVKLADHPLRNVIIKSLKLLNDGMIAKDSSYRLLRYWSALEVLFSDSGGMTKTENIIKRSLFAENEPDIDRLKLDYLSRIRNRYVHEGLGNENIYYLIQFLREHVAKHIVYLLYQGGDFERHDDYLAMCDLPNTQGALEKRREAIVRRELIKSIGRHKPIQRKSIHKR